MSSKAWLDQPKVDLATERILDAAETLYQEHGVAAVTMEEVARAAGCSRATVYRYFDDRVALRTAYVHRETRRVAAEVSAAVKDVTDPRVRIVEAMVLSVAAVRERPALHAWFTSRNAGVTAEMVKDSEVIRGVAASIVGGADDAGAWLVRVIMSLLLFPANSDADERILLERFVAPSVT